MIPQDIAAYFIVNGPAEIAENDTTYSYTLDDRKEVIKVYIDANYIRTGALTVTDSSATDEENKIIFQAGINTTTQTVVDESGNETEETIEVPVVQVAGFKVDTKGIYGGDSTQGSNISIVTNTPYKITDENGNTLETFTKSYNFTDLIETAIPRDNVVHRWEEVKKEEAAALSDDAEDGAHQTVDLNQYLDDYICYSAKSTATSISKYSISILDLHVTEEINKPIEFYLGLYSKTTSELSTGNDVYDKLYITVPGKIGLAD
jgi:hypothetical protein